VTTVEELRRLLDPATPGSTGTLRVSGPVAGVIHVIDGRIAAAESPAVPSVDERQAADMDVAPWSDAAGARATVESAVLDALVALRHGLVEWIDPPLERPPVDVGWRPDEAVERVAAVVASLAAALPGDSTLSGDTIVALGVPGGVRTLTYRGWALTTRVHGPTTVLALARATRMALYEVLVEVDALLRGELLTEVPAAPAPRRPSPVPVDGPAVPAPRLPRRSPGSTPGLTFDLSGIPARDPEGRPFETPDEHTLRRVLGLLKAL